MYNLEDWWVVVIVGMGWSRELENLWMCKIMFLMVVKWV